MAPAEGALGRGAAVLAGLLTPLRLPGRVIEALESLADAAGELRPIHEELTRVRRQTEPLAELMPALNDLRHDLTERVGRLHRVIVALEGDESHLNLTSRKLVREVNAMQESLGGLQDEIARITDRLPDPGEKRGPLQTAREVLTGT